jgi:hypothetical protein
MDTLQYFTKNFVQRKAYRNNCAANNSFDSAAHINDIPTNRSIVSISSDITTRDFYIEGFEELLVAERKYVAKEHTPTPDKPDPVALIRMELDTQHKQFDLIMNQNFDLLVATAKGNGRGGWQVRGWRWRWGQQPTL